jgi:hypothetical protein
VGSETKTGCSTGSLEGELGSQTSSVGSGSHTAVTNHQTVGGCHRIPTILQCIDYHLTLDH